jgi:stage II sporulation protein R
MILVQTKRKLKIIELALLVGLAAALVWGAWSMNTQRALAEQVVRLHILANSDTDEDQALKLEVRDAVLARAAALLDGVDDREEAERVLRARLPELQSIAEEEIAAKGYGYPVSTELRNVAFPTREYEDFTLPAGRYLALRIVIGSGEGHNWWCVVFPPLCAETTTDIAEAAMAAGLSEEDVKLITEADEGYVLKFKSIELWESLRSRLTEKE